MSHDLYCGFSYAFQLRQGNTAELNYVDAKGHDPSRFRRFCFDAAEPLIFFRETTELRKNDGNARSLRQTAVLARSKTRTYVHDLNAPGGRATVKNVCPGTNDANPENYT